MRPTIVDRLMVIWIAAAMVVWSAVLVVLWGWVFSSSGGSTAATLAALFLAVACTAAIPGRAARAYQRLGAWLKLSPRGGPVAMLLSVATDGGAGRSQIRAMVRLLGVAAIFAVACGSASTLAIYAAPAVLEALALRFGFEPEFWAALELIVKFLAMLPFALAMSVAFLAGAILRGGSGRDVYASICRDWLWAVSAALAIFSLTWWAGANLLAVMLAAAAALLLGAMVLFSRQRLTIRPRRLIRPVDAAGRRGRRLAIFADFAAVVVVLLVQFHLLGRLGVLSLGGRVLWAALSLGLLVLFLKRADRKTRPPGGAQGAAAVVGVAAGVLMQSGLVMAGASGGIAAAACVSMAAGAQVPLAALAAMLLSRHRRLFAIGGGRARAYVASASAGAAAGFLAYLAVALLAAHRPALPAVSVLVAAMAVLAGGCVCGVTRARRTGGQLRWAWWAVVIMSALAAGAIAQVRASGASPGILRWRSGGVTRAVAEVMSGHPGRWWVVGDSPADLPDPVPAGVRTVYPLLEFFGGGSPARTVPPTVWAGCERFDGILLATLPADHPQAWRCYNERAIRRWHAGLHEGGVLALRVQARRGGLAAAIAVAKTFREAIGAGWAVGAMHDGALDLLLVGPADRLDHRPSRRDGIFVLSCKRLCQVAADVPAILLTRPASRHVAERHLGAGELTYWLQLVAPD